jgi:hypothetical protein
MAAKPLKGVGGVLGSLISEPTPEPETSATPDEPVTPEPADQAAPATAIAKPRPKSQGRVTARRGRPPGQKPGDAADKEKVTLRLNKELMDDYREWSWEERCQLGELVERALLQYHKSRARQKSQ